MLWACALAAGSLLTSQEKRWRYDAGETPCLEQGAAPLGAGRGRRPILDYADRVTRAVFMKG